MRIETTTNRISFYTRYTQDIQQGKKNITIRDKSESSFVPGDLIHSVTNPGDEWIADLRVLDVYPVTLDELTEKHAVQENMTLETLKATIKEIYPSEDQFYVIEYKVEHFPEEL